VRVVSRVVVAAVGTLLTLYVVYLLRQPLLWLVLALFLAVATSRPVNALSRSLPRGVAITVVYLGVVLAPTAIAASLVPPVVEQTTRLVDQLPTYSQKLNHALKSSDTLQKANQQFNLVGKVRDLASKLGSRLGNAPTTLANVGGAVVSSLFALITILVLSIFMVARGQRWRAKVIASRPVPERETLSRALDGMASAVGGYVAGALAQASIAGIVTFIVLTVLGVPYSLALAVVVGVLDLIPLVGATLGGVLVAMVTLFSDFPVNTIVWAVFAIVYQQFENYVVQPRIQSRASQLDSFVVIIAALFGGTLLGVLGAVLAIPAAAAIQVAVREYRRYRRQLRGRVPSAVGS
jgi:predicted PurR-regulated permease PerM